MSEPCRERWRLFGRVEKTQREALEIGQIDEAYQPFQDAMTAYRNHFKTCPACRVWADEWETHEQTSTPAALG